MARIAWMGLVLKEYILNYCVSLNCFIMWKTFSSCVCVEGRRCENHHVLRLYGRDVSGWKTHRPLELQRERRGLCWMCGQVSKHTHTHTSVQCEELSVMCVYVVLSRRTLKARFSLTERDTPPSADPPDGTQTLLRSCSSFARSPPTRSWCTSPPKTW